VLNKQKSTGTDRDTRLDFKLAFCPTQFATETTGWRTVIQLNLIRYYYSSFS
jgi:hypothetical protein